MIVNDNFVVRNIYDTVILFPIKRNNLSNDPIYINNVIYQILMNVSKFNNKKDLCDSVIKLFNLIDSNDINEVISCVDELIKIGLIIEVKKDEQ